MPKLHTEHNINNGTATARLKY